MQERLSSLRNFFYPSKCDFYPRVGHRVIQTGHRLLVFGGLNGVNQYMSQVLIINSESMSIDVVITLLPLRLESFSLFAFNQQIYIWGGRDPIGPKNKLWRFIRNDYEDIPQQGSVPSPRYCHASCLVANRYLLVMGGCNEKKFMRDWHLLDCTTWTWTKPQINIKIPYSFSPQIFWNGGRGFLMLGETFDSQKKQLSFQSKLYEFSFENQMRCIKITPIVITEGHTQTLAKIHPSPVLFVHQSPYLMLLGGQADPNEAIDHSNDVGIFNLQTLQWTIGQSMLRVGYGFEIVHIQQKLYLIGGVSSFNKELVPTVEVVDLNSQPIQAKICQVCKQLYGMSDITTNPKQFSIKYETNSNNKSFFSSATIDKMARLIRNPLLALGLLIDNSISMNGTNISLSFGKIKAKQFVESSLDYDLIQITDNSLSFSQSQILQCVHSFGMKSQQRSTDKKYEQELQLRSDFSIYLKLASLRLGQSVLFVTTTEEDVFVCFFSTLKAHNCTFNVLYYFISTENEVSSPINRQMIAKKVKGKVPVSYEHKMPNINTKIYIFNLNETLETLVESGGQISYQFEYSSSKVLSNLRLYLESLYLNPYFGRLIKLQGRLLKYINYPEEFKKDQGDKKISKLQIAIKSPYLINYAFYETLLKSYARKQVLVFHNNRLIESFEQKMLCGFAVVSPDVPADLAKSRLQTHQDEMSLVKVIDRIRRGVEEAVAQKETNEEDKGSQKKRKGE